MNGDRARAPGDPGDQARAPGGGPGGGPEGEAALGAAHRAVPVGLWGPGTGNRTPKGPVVTCGACKGLLT